MTLEENIKAILECNFDIAKDEVIEAATKRIMEQIERQNPLEDIKAEIEQLPTKTRTNWDGCCPDLDYPEIEYVDISKKELLSIIDKHVRGKDNKQCGNCKYCKISGSIFDVGIGYCTKTDEVTRGVRLGSYCCDDYEEGDSNNGK